MVTVTSASRYITPASRYHPRYHSRSSIYICGLIPRNFAELAELIRLNQVPYLTLNTIWESDKTQECTKCKRAKRSALSQQVSTRLKIQTRQTTKINMTNKKDPKEKHHHGTVSKKSLEGLNMFNGNNLTLKV